MEPVLLMETLMKNTVTLKEIFERLIILETKMDSLENSQMFNRKHATRLTALIIISVLMDIGIHFVLWLTTHQP